MLLTVIPNLNKKIIGILNTEIELKKAKEKNIIKAYIGNKEIGEVSNNDSVLLEQCLKGKQIYTKFEEKINAKVEKTENVNVNGIKKEIYLVNVNNNDLNNINEILSENELTISLYFGGIYTKYINRDTLINDFKNNNISDNLKFNIENEKIVIYYKDELAGIEDMEKSKFIFSIKDIEEFKNTLINNKHLLNKVKLRVIRTEASKYVVEFSVFKKEIEKIKEDTSKNQLLNGINSQINEEFRGDIDYLNQVKEIISYLTKSGFTAENIKKILKSHKKYPKNVQFRIPRPKNYYIENSSKQLLKITFAAISFKRHLLCKGGKSTGKNKFIETVAWIYQRPLYTFSTNADVDKYDLLGCKTFDTTIEEGKEITTMKFSPDILLEAMENGGIFNLDEINFAESGILALLHSVVDDQRKIQVPGYKEVKCNDHFTLIGSMNEKYIGTKKLNLAFNDRFIPLQFEYPQSIYQILKNKGIKVKDDYIKRVDLLYKNMVKLIKANDKSMNEECLSVRSFEQALEISTVIGIDQAIEVCVIDKLSDDRYKNTIKNILNSI